MGKKIVCISDTHGLHRLKNLNEDIGEGWMIIHAGDISNRGLDMEIKDFLDWYSSLPFVHKVFIAGNHDFGFEMYMDDIDQEYKDKGVIYLKDQMVEIDGVKIYGSPWQPTFYNWAFNLDRGEAIAKKWTLIPEGLDILITHGPAFSILDDTPNGLKVGCEDLYKRIMEVKPKYHLCGHIHYGYGMRSFDDMHFINASSLNEQYKYRNKPIMFYI